VGFKDPPAVKTGGVVAIAVGVGVKPQVAPLVIPPRVAAVVGAKRLACKQSHRAIIIDYSKHTPRPKKPIG